MALNDDQLKAAIECLGSDLVDVVIELEGRPDTSSTNLYTLRDALGALIVEAKRLDNT